VFIASDNCCGLHQLSPHHHPCPLARPRRAGPVAQRAAHVFRIGQQVWVFLQLWGQFLNDARQTRQLGLADHREVHLTCGSRARRALERRHNLARGILAVLVEVDHRGPLLRLQLVLLERGVGLRELADILDQQSRNRLHWLNSQLLAHLADQVRPHVGLEDVLLVSNLVAQIGEQQINFGDPRHALIA